MQVDDVDVTPKGFSIFYLQFVLNLNMLSLLIAQGNYFWKVLRKHKSNWKDLI